MTLQNIIRDRTDDGVDIIDFLVNVMRNELTGFKPCHRLDAARLLVKYERDEALNFTLDYTPDPSRSRSDSRSSDNSYFDQKLAQVIQQSTDDGRRVCRFLINVMEGELKTFKPHHRIAAARELLSRGFGKHARQSSSLNNRPPLPAGEGWGESLPRTRSGGENLIVQPTPYHTPQPATQPTKSEESPNPTNQSSDNPEHDEDPAAYRARWDKIWEEVTPIIEEGKRVYAEQQPDPDNPPYATDMSVFDQAWQNSEKWFHEWKNSLDPEEFQAIVKEGAERFDAKIDARVERRKQIKADRERREKEEAEREVEQAKARVKAKEKTEAESAAKKEEEDLGPPPSRSEHERWSPTPSIPTSFRLVNCGHPKCKLHDGPAYYPEDDKSSPYYNPGSVSMGPPTSAVFDSLMASRRPP